MSENKFIINQTYLSDSQTKVLQDAYMERGLTFNTCRYVDDTPFLMVMVSRIGSTVFDHIAYIKKDSRVETFLMDYLEGKVEGLISGIDLLRQYNTDMAVKCGVAQPFVLTDRNLSYAVYGPVI